MRPTAAIYARYSTKNQDPRSIDDQVRNCEEYARSEDLEVAARFADEGISGSRDDRPGLERMLRAAKHKPAPFQHLLIDDSSRLSRDDIDAKTIVFRTLRSLGVVVHEVTSGMRSDDESAELMWGVKGLIDAQYIRDLRKKTHRGLKGRALAGFHTGGRCFGYKTVEEPDPADPEHPRAVVRVDREQAAVVRRIFKDYVAGVALGRIASALNEKGLAAPYDDPSHTKPAGRGWSAVQVHTMLRNERYTGRVVWNKREWVKDPVTKKRRPRMRPESEWVVKEDPELRIVQQDLWEAAQARHRTNGPRGGGVVNGKKKVRLLSGMLRCGTCGGAMSIVGARGEWANYGCSAHHSKGDAICANGKLISERRVTDQVMSGLADFVQSPQFQDYVEQSTAAADRAKRKTLGGDVQRLQAAVEAQAARAMRAGERFMDSDGSQAMKAILQREEAKLRVLQQQLSEASPKEPKQAPPDYRKAGKAIEDILALVAVNPEGARVRLARFLNPVVLIPEADEATGKIEYAFDISLKNDSASLAGGRSVPSVVDGLGCGGALESNCATLEIPKRDLYARGPRRRVA